MKKAIIENEVAAVRWHQFRIYPKEFVLSGGNPARRGLGSHRSEMSSMPETFVLPPASSPPAKLGALLEEILGRPKFQ